MSAGGPLQGDDDLCYLDESRFGALLCPSLALRRSRFLAAADALRTRRTFARLDKTVDVPNLIDIQRRSFAWLTDPEKGGLRETIDDISPIEDYTGTLAVEFGEYSFDAPSVDIAECRETDRTFSAPLSMTVRFINRDTGEIREQRVFMGDFPLMTPAGTFL
ncbi:MAG TPA: hypothetical protein VK707_11115, partial [Solirubrobacteraceae bacterium]|nr:hypothetical protein [Solirubrobacteraceae bacterium]